MQDSVLEKIRVSARQRANEQSQLLNADGLAKLAKKLGFGWFSEEDIVGLWKIGLLRADLITTPAVVTNPDYLAIEATNGLTCYCDIRQMAHRIGGYGNSICESEIDVSDWILEFHPYRVYVLYHVKRTLMIHTTSTQFLRYEAGVLRVVESELESARRWTSSLSFGERFHYWNTISEIASVVEPLSYSVINFDMEPEHYTTPASSPYEQDVLDMLIDLGKVNIQNIRQDLTFAAETLDNNRSIHVLIRLSKAKERLNITGELGGALHFLSMSEVIRRASERAHKEALPEEDEIGGGQWFPGARKTLYGAERVFDAPKSILRDYMAYLGLDFGVKVRCYVEGDTEYGTLLHAVGAFEHVQLINLSGSIAERGRKGLAFSESLIADKSAGIFSVVVLDGDQAEYIRILRKAAQEEKFFGSFFISTPDIEMGNFSKEELIDIVIGAHQLEKSLSNNTEEMKRSLLNDPMQIKSGKDFFHLLKRHNFSDFRKSEEWGKTLMTYAIKYPFFSEGDVSPKELRTIVAAAKLLVKVRDVGFLRSLSREKIDPNTGRVIARASN